MVHVAAASGAFTAASGAIGMAEDDEEFAEFWLSLMVDLPTDFTAASATAGALSGLQLTDLWPRANRRDRQRAFWHALCRSPWRVCAKVNRPWAKVNRPWAKVDRPWAQVDRPWPKVHRPWAKVDRPWANAAETWAKVDRPWAKVDRPWANAAQTWAKPGQMRPRHGQK